MERASFCADGGGGGRGGGVDASAAWVAGVAAELSNLERALAQRLLL